MAQLHVRNVPDEVVSRLKQRAAQHGRSMEAEHRRILLEALRPGLDGQSLLDILQAGPFADPDFELQRAEDRGRDVEL